MTGIVDPLAQDHEALPPAHDPAPRWIIRGRSLPQKRLVFALVVILGLAAMIGAVAVSGRMGDRLRRGVSAQVASGTTLETASERGWVRLGVGERIPEGARVRTGGSEVRLQLRGGQVWLGSDAAARVFSQRVDLIRGDAMVVNPSGGRLGARWTDVVVSGAGVFRLTPGVDPRVGVYSGSVRVHRLAESRLVGALEQMSLSTRHLPVSSAPLGYHPQDPWDRELLGQAIAFDDEVERIARGIDVRFTLEAKPPDFYRVFRAVDDATIPILRSIARTITPDGRFGPASDVLVTLFVAEAGAEANDKPLSAAATQTATWRAEGARWGLVAMRLGITASDFAETVDLSQIDRLAARRAPPASSPLRIAGSGEPAPAETATAPRDPGEPDARPAAQPTTAATGAGDPAPPSDPQRPLLPLPTPVPSLSPAPAVPDITGQGGPTHRQLGGTPERQSAFERLLDLFGLR